MTTMALVHHTMATKLDRVREHTAAPVNRRIDRQTQAAIEEAIAGGREAIVRRLVELDHEWDVDRALMANFAVVGGTTFGVGLKRFADSPVGRRRTGWLTFFASQLGFLMMHAAIGWCPPAPVFRRLGFRTRVEIENERMILERALGAAQPIDRQG